MVETSQYAWKEVRVRFLGREIIAILEFRYKRMVNKEHLHGRGSKPIAIQAGNETTEGSITVMQSELQALTAALGLVNLLNIRFDLVVTYDDGAGNVTTDIVSSVSCQEYEKGMAQGDLKMEIEIPFLAMDILEDV